MFTQIVFICWYKAPNDLILHKNELNVQTRYYMIAKEKETENKRNYVRLGQAADILGVSKRYMYHLVRTRRINHFKSACGKLIYFRIEDLEKWMTSTHIVTQSEVEVMAEKRACTQNWE